MNVLETPEKIIESAEKNRVGREPEPQVFYFYALKSQMLNPLAISQSPGSSRANSVLPVGGQEIWQHTFKLKV